LVSQKTVQGTCLSAGLYFLYNIFTHEKEPFLSICQERCSSSFEEKTPCTSLMGRPVYWILPSNLRL